MSLHDIILTTVRTWCCSACLNSQNKGNALEKYCFLNEDFHFNGLYGDKRQHAKLNHSQSDQCSLSAPTAFLQEAMVYCSRLKCSEKKAAECMRSLTFTGEEEEE